MLPARLLRKHRIWVTSLRTLTSGQQSQNDSFRNLDLTFRNTLEGYKSKSSVELLRGLLVLRMCSITPLVKYNQYILKWFRKLFGKRLFSFAMKSTMYGHFVGGETQDDVKKNMIKMSQFGVKAILDYSVEQDISHEEAKEKTVEHAIPPAEDTNIPTIDRYQVHEDFADRRQDVSSARTYFYEGEPECDKNAEIFCSCIDAVSETTESTGFLAMKLTALGRPHFLMKLSEVICQTQLFYRALTGSSWENLVKSKLSPYEFETKLKEFGIKTDDKVVRDWFSSLDFGADGFVDIYEWGRLLDKNFRLGDMFKILNLRTGSLEPLIQNLGQMEEQQFSNMMDRVSTIIERAQAKGVRVMIDAEQTYFQPAISRLTLELMRKYNKERADVFNTYQAYLKNVFGTINIDMHLAARENFYFGAKLVRGAYMEQERKRAEAIGYEDPINPTYEETNLMYERVFLTVLDEAERRQSGEVSVMCATHNEDSVRFAVQKMSERGIGPLQKIVCFAQLYGMCDQMSFSLGQAGYSVYKYVPYGPVEEVIPYLSRRAIENSSGILGSSSKERDLMWSELKRRWTSGDWWHSVQPNGDSQLFVLRCESYKR